MTENQKKNFNSSIECDWSNGVPKNTLTATEFRKNPLYVQVILIFCIRVPVFYCLIENIQITKFLPIFFSLNLILTSLDQTHRDLGKMGENHEKKKIGKYLVILIFSLKSKKTGTLGSIYL